MQPCRQHPARPMALPPLIAVPQDRQTPFRVGHRSRPGTRTLLLPEALQGSLPPNSAPTENALSGVGPLCAPLHVSCKAILLWSTPLTRFSSHRQQLAHQGPSDRSLRVLLVRGALCRGRTRTRAVHVPSLDTA